MHWEKLAEDTNYVVTPANAVSLAGSLATWGGLNAHTNGHDGRATMLVGLGRTLDLLDGPIARATNTSSTRGEALDAAIDKVLMARSLKVLIDKDNLSGEEIAGLVVHNSLSAAASIIAEARGVEIHPSKTGKRATAIEWAGIGLAILGGTKFISEHPKLDQKINTIKKAAIMSGAILGTISAVDYLRQSLAQE